MKRTYLLAALLACTPALVHGDEIDAAKYRESVYHVIGWNWKLMGGMVRGDTAFDRADFSKRAARLSFLAHQLDEAYPAGSDKDSDALPAIWDNRADFDAKLEDFQREAQALRIATASADEDALKAQFKKVGGTCKACHDEYRAD